MCAKIKDSIQDFDDSGYDYACNGCHSGTVIAEKHDGRYRLQLHWNPIKKCLVEINNWYVMSEDDVMPEFEVVGVHYSTGILPELFKKYA